MSDHTVKPITVRELIAFLQQQPQHLPVAYRLHSEQELLQLDYIGIEKLQTARPDGWVHHARPDAEQVDYLLFPGN